MYSISLKQIYVNCSLATASYLLLANCYQQHDLRTGTVPPEDVSPLIEKKIYRPLTPVYWSITFFEPEGCWWPTKDEQAMQLGRGSHPGYVEEVRATGKVRRRHQSLPARSDSTFQLVLSIVREVGSSRNSAIPYTICNSYSQLQSRGLTTTLRNTR